jgi:hypothetical protein
MRLLIVFGFLVVPLSAAAPAHPLEQPEGWQFGDRAAWTWSKEGGASVLTLHKQQDFKPKVRSPFNLAWFTTTDWKSFTLTVEARLTKFDAGNNDLCIAFGRQEDTRFYYAHLGEKADGVHHQLHLVDRADRRAITAARTAGTPWQSGTWHRIKVVHDARAGKIAVYFDDLNQPVLTAEDKTLAHGWIGLGSFDDLGQFRNLEIRGN